MVVIKMGKKMVMMRVVAVEEVSVATFQTLVVIMVAPPLPTNQHHQPTPPPTNTTTN